MEVEWTPLTHDELRLRRSGGVRRNTARTRNVLAKESRGHVRSNLKGYGVKGPLSSNFIDVVFCQKLAPLVIMTEWLAIRPYKWFAHRSFTSN